MWTAGEDTLDLDLLRRVASEGGLETVGGRFPAGAHQLMALGYIKECAVGVNYVCWKVTQRGLDALT